MSCDRVTNNATPLAMKFSGIADDLTNVFPFQLLVLNAMPFIGELSAKDLDGLTVEDLLDGG